MRAEGKAIIIITHKLHEVMAISDRVAVLRKGEHIATVETAHTTEAELTEMMVGKKVELNIERRAPVNPVERLTVEGLRCLNQEGIPVLRDVSFTARAGEILGYRRHCGQRTEGASGVHRRIAAPGGRYHPLQ